MMGLFRVLVLLLLATSGIVHSNIGLQNTLDRIVEKSTVPLKFVEIHSETSFTDEIRITGKMLFTAEGVMKKYIFTPKKSEAYIVGNVLTLIEKGEKREISLLNYPIIASSINAIRWLLSGDKDKILDNYFIEYSEQSNSWKLELTPKYEDILSEISSILIIGHLGYIDTIKLIKSDDTSILTTFSRL